MAELITNQPRFGGAPLKAITMSKQTPAQYIVAALTSISVTRVMTRRGYLDRLCDLLVRNAPADVIELSSGAFARIRTQRTWGDINNTVAALVTKYEAY